jgi:hypothetical protein
VTGCECRVDWVPCLLSERSETASMYIGKNMPTASVGMAPINSELTERLLYNVLGVPVKYIHARVNYSHQILSALS